MTKRKGKEQKGDDRKEKREVAWKGRGKERKNEEIEKKDVVLYS